MSRILCPCIPNTARHPAKKHDILALELFPALFESRALLAKRLFQMRSQGLLKSSYVTGAALRPLYVVISKTLKNLEHSTLSQVRNNIIKASEEIERFK